MTDSPPGGPPVAADRLRAALLAERLRLHARSMSSAVSAAALLALVTAALLWDGHSHAALGVWLAVLAAALAGRVGVRAAHARLGGSDESSARWLWYYRAGFVGHGLAWALPSITLLPQADAAQAGLLVFAVAAVCAGSLIVTAFDLVAAVLFLAPALGPLLLHAPGRVEADATTLALAALAVGAVALLAALRARSSMLDSVRLRLAEQDRTGQAERHAEAAERARAALAEQHHLMRLLLQTSEQGYWFIDVLGNTVEVNPAMCRLLGRRSEDIVGRSAIAFFEGEDRAVLAREVEQRRLGVPGSYEVAIRRPDGTRVHVHNSATPLYDTQGRRVGSVGIWTDITARREAQAALHTYELVANSITDMVSVIDEHRVYRMVNDAWCRQVGLSRRLVLGHRMSEFAAHGATEDRLHAFDECLQTRQVRTLRARMNAGQLKGRFLESVFYPYADHAPGVRCVVIVTRDITEQEAARLQLLESADSLARVLNATGDAIFASDATSPTQPVRFVNEQMLRMWGIPAEEAAGLTPQRITDYALKLWADPAHEVAHCARVVADNVGDESRVELIDGRVLLRRCIVARLGERPVRVWSFRDITAEERALQLAQANDAEQRARLDAFPGYICALDDERRYTYVNDRLAALMGRPPAQLVGRPLREEAGADAWIECEREFRRALGGERAVAERHYPATAAHAAMDLEFTYVVGPQRDGRRAYYLFGLDVTARKQAERALVAARDDAERANRAKSQFLAQMSHELRTPMNAILGLGQLLASDPKHPLLPAQQAYLEEMLRGARHLLELINEVLDFGRIEAGQIDVQPVAVPLAALCDECLALVAPLAAERAVQLPHAGGLPAHAVVRADRRRLRQVVLNLLGNAIKYNRRGGRVMLECREDGGGWRLGVRDTGAGLSADECARLFQPFERLGAGRTDTEGTGIGLALSRRLVQAMDGRIGVDSEPGVGSLFWLSLPAAGAEDGPGAEPAAAAPLAVTVQPAATDGHRPLVLYIEDNPVNVFIMEAMFDRLPDFRLVSALRPAEGLVIARRDQPALVLLDMQLPDIDGLDVLQRLREHPATASIPVVAVSANAMAADVDAARAAGAVAYLTKPLELGLLDSTLRSLVPRAADAAVSVEGLPDTGT